MYNKITETQDKLNKALYKNKLQMHYYKEGKKIISEKKIYGYRTCNNKKCRVKLPKHEMIVPKWTNNKNSIYYLCPDCYNKLMQRKSRMK